MLLTYNEERNLPRVLSSVSGWASQVVVVDSFSSDRTLPIAEEHGAEVHQHPFVNHAVQFNWALDHVPIAHEWILRLDADEWLTDALKEELHALLQSPAPDVAGVYLNRRMYFMNRWLKHGGLYPHYILRLFRRGAGRYEEKTEEHLVLNYGRAVYATNDFGEDNRQNTIKYWLKKHDDLSDGELRDTLLETVDAEKDLLPSLFGTKIQRTRWFKVHLYARCPLFIRAFLYFFYRYIIRLGFLDGHPGLIFHVLQAFWYRFYIDARIYEQRSRWQETTIDYSQL
jgi:glycosyltransferase involved in cell wall biosynthesis